MKIGDISEDEAKRSEFMRMALQFALVEPAVTDKQAESLMEKWPAGDVLRIFNGVMEVSGMAAGFSEGDTS